MHSIYRSGKVHVIVALGPGVLYICLMTLQIGSYSGLDSSPYGIPKSNEIEDKPVCLVYYQ